MKKILKPLLLLAMLLISLLALASCKISTNMDFRLSEDGSYYEFWGAYDSKDATVIIPPFHKFKPVKEIAWLPYDAKSVKIPFTVKTIHSFQAHDIEKIRVSIFNLKYRSIDGNLYSKNGRILFSYAGGKPDASFVVPNRVKEIYAGVFLGADNLVSITIPSSVTGAIEYYYPSYYQHDFEKRNYDFLSIHAPRVIEVVNNSSLSIYPGYPYERDWFDVHTGESRISKSGDYLFYEKDGVNYLVDYDGKKKQISLPESYNGKDYVVKGSAFYGEDGISSINIPNGVTAIQSGAFSGCSVEKITFAEGSQIASLSGAFMGCSNLTSIEIPDNVTDISGAFMGCSNLTSIEIPDNVTDISGAFIGCSSLTSIEIPDSVTDISGAFSGCESLETLVLGDGITCIEPKEFSSMYSLVNVTLGDGVESIGDKAFWHCRNLSSITIPGSVSSIGEYAFRECENLKTVILENGVKSISDSAFYGCENLESITIPESVTDIGSNVFTRCDNLSNVHISSIENWLSISIDLHPFVHVSQFRECSHTHDLYIDGSLVENVVIPDGVTSIGSYAFSNCTSLTSVTIPEGVTSIGNYAFSNCTSLTSVTIPNSVTSIGNYAFSNCTSLTSVTIPEGVTSIGNYAFSSCSSLTSITIPDSVTSIGSYAFENCKSLTSVTIGNSVTSIGNNAFYNCGKLIEVINHSLLNIEVGSKYHGYVAYYAKEVHTGESKIVNVDDYLFYSYNGVNYLLDYVGNNTKLVLPEIYNGEEYEIGESVFLNRNDIMSVVISNSVTSISKSAFSGCASLTSVIIPNSVTSISKSAFSGCASLKSITIPDSVTSIDNNTFSYCSSLTSVIIPNSVTSISRSAFLGCTSLRSITIPDSVTSIGNSAFESCESLTSITIPSDVEIISHEAFYGCSGLEEIIFAENSQLLSIGDWAFGYCKNLKSIVIPDSVTSIGDRAFSGCFSLTSVTIGSGITEIGGYAFYACVEISNVTFKKYDGWWYSSSSIATSGTSISAEELSDPETAAKYLSATYRVYYWYRE